MTAKTPCCIRGKIKLDYFGEAYAYFSTRKLLWRDRLRRVSFILGYDYHVPAQAWSHAHNYERSRRLVLGLSHRKCVQ